MKLDMIKKFIILSIRFLLLARTNARASVVSSNHIWTATEQSNSQFRLVIFCCCPTTLHKIFMRPSNSQLSKTGINVWHLVWNLSSYPILGNDMKRSKRWMRSSGKQRRAEKGALTYLVCNLSKIRLIQHIAMYISWIIGGVVQTMTY